MYIRGIDKIQNSIDDNSFKIKDAHALNISEKDIDLGMRVHPNTRKMFISIFGKINYMNKFIRLLSKGREGISLLNAVENPDYFKLVRDLPTINIDNYWEIIKLVQTDRILSDSKLVKEIVKEKDLWINKKFNLYTVVKNGLIKNEVLDKRMSRYAGNLKDIFYYILEEYDELIKAGKTPDEIFSKENYKEVKNAIKNKIYLDTIANVDGDLLSTFDIKKEDLENIFLK